MKKMYRKLIRSIENFILKIHIIKTWIFEWYSILKKFKQYKHIVWTKNQQRNFDNFWVKYYGKKISKRWHKLYQSTNGIFNVDYFPEILFTTKFEPKLNPLQWAKSMSDKSLVELLYGGDEQVRFPKTIVLNCSGFFYDHNRTIINWAKAMHMLYDSGDIVIKPIIGGSSGTGVKVLRIEKGIDVESSEKIEAIINAYKINYIVQERLKPNTIYAILYPDAINTVRIITYMVNDNLYHVPLSLRVGVNGNKVDNIHAGGIVIGIKESGRLRKFGYDNDNNKYNQHPNTGVKFNGYELPRTKEIINAAYRLHGKTPHIGLISWDFMINRNNNVVLIEVNLLGQSIWFPQIIHGAGPFGRNTKEALKLIKI